MHINRIEIRLTMNSSFLFLLYLRIHVGVRTKSCDDNLFFFFRRKDTVRHISIEERVFLFCLHLFYMRIQSMTIETSFWGLLNSGITRKEQFYLVIW